MGRGAGELKYPLPVHGYVEKAPLLRTLCVQELWVLTGAAYGAGNAEKPAEPGAPAAYRLACERIGREAGEKTSDGDAAFEPGEVHADALMWAGAEGDVTVGVAGEVEAVRLLELSRIAVGSADAQRDPAFRGQRDAANVSRARADPVAELVRALEAQELLHRGLDQLGRGRAGEPSPAATA